MSEMSLPSISQGDLRTYQIVKTSTAPVYKSTYLPTGSPVFIKRLPLAEQNKRDRQIILRAVEYASRRRSERLAEIVGLLQTPNTILIVTVWMSNESLHSLLYQQDLYPTLPLSIRIRILADVAAGLSFLHNQQHPILFQRLKPCNILLDAQYRAKLSDFWLLNFQKVRFSENQQENASVIYLSPQRLQNHVLNTADDIYSLGIILYETLSRKQPFQENNPLKLETEITRGIRPQPNIEVILEETSLQPSQCANLTRLTHICWHQDPLMRPTADECLTRLNDVLQNFSKEDIQRDVDTLNTGKRAVQQPQEHIMEFDIKYLDEGWSSRSHMSRAQSLPEESTEEDLLCPQTRKEKRSASLPVSGSKINIHVPTTCPEQMRRTARNCGVGHMQRNGADCHSSPHLVWAQNYTETLKKNRETILKKVTEGHLNHLIDIMRSKFVLSRDDSENINAERTLKERTRKCLDTCSEKGEVASRMFLDVLTNSHVFMKCC